VALHYRQLQHHDKETSSHSKFFPKSIRLIDSVPYKPASNSFQFTCSCSYQQPPYHSSPSPTSPNQPSPPQCVYIPEEAQIKSCMSIKAMILFATHLNFPYPTFHLTLVPHSGRPAGTATMSHAISHRPMADEVIGAPKPPEQDIVT
jgi:hypothetical protein